jgi:F0F1-type ATP synthase membrane subunit b/b'
VAECILALLKKNAELDNKIDRLDSIVDKFSTLYFNLSSKFEVPYSIEGLPEPSTQDLPDDRLAHIDSLKSLAENTIIEAHRQAEMIRTESESKAQLTAAAIITEAKEQAHDIIRQAREKADEENLQAKQDVEQLLQRSRHVLEGQIRGMFDQASKQLLDQETINERECSENTQRTEEDHSEK